MIQCHIYFLSASSRLSIQIDFVRSTPSLQEKWQPIWGPKMKFSNNFFLDYFYPGQGKMHGIDHFSGPFGPFHILVILFVWYINVLSDSPQKNPLKSGLPMG